MGSMAPNLKLPEVGDLVLSGAKTSANYACMYVYIYIYIYFVIFFYIYICTYITSKYTYIIHICIPYINSHLKHGWNILRITNK